MRGCAKSLIGFSLHRDRRTFTERDRLVLNLLQPHLIQAWQNTKLAGETLGRAQLLEDALEARKEGIVFLGTDRKVRFSTPSAMRYIAKYFGTLAGDDRLPAELDAWVAHQEGLLNQGVFAAPQRPLVKAGYSGSELTVTLLPGETTLTLIMQEKVVIEDLTSLGLSRRESDVLLWVSRGKSNAEIALILDVTVSTVRKHLEDIFQKLGVESRTSAATLAMTKLGISCSESSSRLSQPNYP